MEGFVLNATFYWILKELIDFFKRLFFVQVVS